jgi:hypothetical protein
MFEQKREAHRVVQWVMSWVMSLDSVWLARINTPSHTSWLLNRRAKSCLGDL